MKEKLEELLEGCPGYPLDLSDAEQQVWHNAQRAMLEVGYRKPEPQQPEGELVDACKECGLRINGVCVDIEFNKVDCERWDLVEAQLAHDKQRMLPSEDELYELLLKVKPLVALKLGESQETFYPLRGISKELLRLLGGNP